jgi:hypothetical protein
VAYYAEHREELYARREAVREAAWQAHLKALEKEHRKRVALEADAMAVAAPALVSGGRRSTLSRAR